MSLSCPGYLHRAQPGQGLSSLWQRQAAPSLKKIGTQEGARAEGHERTLITLTGQGPWLLGVWGRAGWGVPPNAGGGRAESLGCGIPVGTRHITKEKRPQWLRTCGFKAAGGASALGALPCLRPPASPRPLGGKVQTSFHALRHLYPSPCPQPPSLLSSTAVLSN